MKKFESKICVGPDGEALKDLKGLTKLRAGIYRVTTEGLGHNHGPDRNRPLVVGLWDGDIISLRPQGTRREPVTITAVHLYEYCLRCESNKAQLERARKKKDQKATRLARLRQERAEKRLTRPFDRGARS